MKTKSPAVAVSSHLFVGHSSTTYFLSPALHWKNSATVAVFAPICAVADAFTKVVMHAPLDAARRCAIFFNCEALILDESGVVLATVAGA